MTGGRRKPASCFSRIPTTGGILIVDQNRRPSIYLQERADGLARVFDFFTAPHRGQAPGFREMLVVFLSQIGFWEWELDNLVYAFTTFEERATAWEHENGFGMASALRTKGIWIQSRTVKNLKLKRQARSGRGREVFAPMASMNKVIAQWNDLLSFCEQHILISPEECEIATQSGAQLMTDLSKFRKTLLAD